jgi:hypothetical protein
MNANSGATSINPASIGLRFPDAANPKPTLGIKSVRMPFMLIRFPSSSATRLESCLNKIIVRSYCITFDCQCRFTPQPLRDSDRRHQTPSARYQNCCKAVLRARARALPPLFDIGCQVPTVISSPSIRATTPRPSVYLSSPGHRSALPRAAQNRLRDPMLGTKFNRCGSY